MRLGHDTMVRSRGKSWLSTGCPPPLAKAGFRRFIGAWLAICMNLMAEGSVAAESASPELEAGLVAYYPFDGDLLDASGFKRHAVCDPAGVSPRFLSTRKAVANQVLSLGGGSLGISVPSLAGFGPNGRRGTSVSLWVHCPIQGYLLACVRESVPEQTGFHIRMDGQRMMVSGGVGEEQGFGFPEGPNPWRHVVVVFDRSPPTNEAGMRVEVWVDGRSIGFAPVRVNPLQLRTPLTLGGISGTAQGRLQGQIDSLRLFNKALSQEEALELHARDTADLTGIPVLALQPQSQSVQKGGFVAFRVAAQPSAAVTYQWQRDGVNLPGATGPELALDHVSASLDGGRYRVLVQNGSGSVFSEPARLTVHPLTPPNIVSEPVSVEVAEGEPEVAFSVGAAGSGTLSYQWQRNGRNMPDAQGPRLVLRHVRPFSEGRYRARVSNAYGTVWTDEVDLKVNTYDSDGDGLSDYEELLLKTDARRPDYYGERMPPTASNGPDAQESFVGRSEGDARDGRSLALFALEVLLRTPRPWWIGVPKGAPRPMDPESGPATAGAR